MDIQNGAITITGLSEFEQKLQQLRTDNPGFEKRLRGVIRSVLGEVRSKMQGSARDGLQMKSDPRNAYKAVRYAVYKRIFGGQVNILQSRKAGTETSYKRPRTLRPGQRGGNRRKKEARDLDIYEGRDRGFILRFLNAGTEARYNGGRNGRTLSDREHFISKNEGRYYRGAISARNWFGPRSQSELENAAGNIQAIIDKIINDEFI